MSSTKKPKVSESRADAPSTPLQVGSGNSSTAKRKRADTNNTAMNGSESGQTQKHMRQDNFPDRSASSNCATSSRETSFGIPSLLFRSPFEGEMCLEVATPSTKYERGCIRLHGPHGHWNMDAMFSLSFASIESIIILRNCNRSAGKKRAYEVLIVPTSAIGVAPVSRRHTQVIMFNLPDQKIDARVYGSMTSGVDKNTLVLSLLKNALNERLAEFNKTVTDLVQEDKTSNPIFRIETTLEPVMGTNLEKKNKGLLQFLDGEILFRGKAVMLCIPTRQLNEICLVLANEMRNGIVGMNLVLSVSRPFETTASPNRPVGDAYDILGFRGLSCTLAKLIYRFAEKRNIKVELNKQYFYDYAKNQPMSGYSPASPGSKEEVLA